MKLKQAREITGLSEKTLKIYLRQGKLQGNLVGSGQHRHWEIDPESLSRIEPKPPKEQSDDSSQESSLQVLVTAQQRQLEEVYKELESRRREIQELHVLLQQAQAALPAPKDRPWWRIWGK